jgi:transposase-like protein
MTRPAARDAIYRGHVLDAQITELCVRWYITCWLSYRDLPAMLAERGVTRCQQTTGHLQLSLSPAADSGSQ